MMMIIVINVLLINKILEYRREKLEETIICNNQPKHPEEQKEY